MPHDIQKGYEDALHLLTKTTKNADAGTMLTAEGESMVNASVQQIEKVMSFSTGRALCTTSPFITFTSVHGSRTCHSKYFIQVHKFEQKCEPVERKAF